jgi:hypothetical protein
VFAHTPALFLIRAAGEDGAQAVGGKVTIKLAHGRQLVISVLRLRYFVMSQSAPFF